MLVHSYPSNVQAYEDPRVEGGGFKPFELIKQHPVDGLSFFVMEGSVVIIQENGTVWEKRQKIDILDGLVKEVEGQEGVIAYLKKLGIRELRQ